MDRKHFARRLSGKEQASNHIYPLLRASGASPPPTNKRFRLRELYNAQPTSMLSSVKKDDKRIPIHTEELPRQPGIQYSYTINRHI